jgi:hypothetical protein
LVLGLKYLSIKIQGQEVLIGEAPSLFGFGRVNGDGQQAEHLILADQGSADNIKLGTVLQKKSLLLDLFTIDGLDYQVVVGEIAAVVLHRGRVDGQSFAMLAKDSDPERTHAAQLDGFRLNFFQSGADGSHIIFSEGLHHGVGNLLNALAHFFLEGGSGGAQGGLVGLTTAEKYGRPHHSYPETGTRAENSAEKGVPHIHFSIVLYILFFWHVTR